MYCHECGFNNPERSNFCSECGCKLIQSHFIKEIFVEESVFIEPIEEIDIVKDPTIKEKSTIEKTLIEESAIIEPVKEENITEKTITEKEQNNKHTKKPVVRYKKPTENQIDYACDLGIIIPDGISRTDLSYLIDIKLKKDKQCTQKHREIAKLFDVEVSPYAGKKVLFNKIKEDLNEPGREKELLMWFTYRVYRNLINGANNAIIKSPHDPIIEEIAINLINNKSVIESIKEYTDCTFIWFGSYKASNGKIYHGASKDTIAYTVIKEKLKNKVKISNTNYQAIIIAVCILIAWLIAIIICCMSCHS